MYELLRKSNQSGLSEDYCRYKTYLNKLTSLKRKAKNDYWKNQTKVYGQNKAKIWQFVNRITHFKRKSSTSIKSLVDKHGKKLTNPTDIANSLNDHFGSIGEFMAQKFDVMDHTKLKDPLSYISKEVQNSIFLSLPSADEISKNISKLINKNSCGYDNVSNKTMTATNQSISPYLEILFFFQMY